MSLWPLCTAINDGHMAIVCVFLVTPCAGINTVHGQYMCHWGIIWPVPETGQMASGMWDSLTFHQSAAKTGRTTTSTGSVQGGSTSGFGRFAFTSWHSGLVVSASPCQAQPHPPSFTFVLAWQSPTSLSFASWLAQQATSLCVVTPALPVSKQRKELRQIQRGWRSKVQKQRCWRKLGRWSGLTWWRW